MTGLYLQLGEIFINLDIYIFFFFWELCPSIDSCNTQWNRNDHHYINKFYIWSVYKSFSFGKLSILGGCTGQLMRFVKYWQDVMDIDTVL